MVPSSIGLDNRKVRMFTMSLFPSRLMLTTFSLIMQRLYRTAGAAPGGFPGAGRGQSLVELTSFVNTHNLMRAPYIESCTIIIPDVHGHRNNYFDYLRYSHVSEGMNTVNRVKLSNNMRRA